MKSRFPSIDLKGLPLILDASGIINFLGTAIADRLIRNIGEPVVVAAEAFAEVRRHPIRGEDSKSALAGLASQGLLKVVELGEKGRAIFRELVSEDLTGGLDDGEAATIAAAMEHSVSAVVVIDEKKATRIIGERWPDRCCVDTVTVLAQPQLRAGLSDDAFAAAVFSALVHARMSVPLHGREWTCKLIGAERTLELRNFGSN